MKAIILCLPAILFSFAQAVIGQEASALTLARIVPLPLVQGGFNHMAVDAARQRLFVTAPADKIVEVVDLKTGKVLRSLEGDSPAAALYAPEFDQLYVTRGEGVSIYNGATLKQIASIDLQTHADEIRYDPRAKELYVGCMGAGKTGIAVLALPEGKLLAKIALPGKPQGFAVEEQGRRIYANLPEQRMVVVVDRKMRTVAQQWPLPEVQGITPVALDEERHRLFVGARRPAAMVVLDTDTGKQVAQVAMDGDADDLFFDAANQRIYISCGDGFIDVVEQAEADHYRLRERIATASGARNSAFSAGLHEFFVGVTRSANRPAEIRIFKTLK